jgi:hypothetical protein
MPADRQEEARGTAPREQHPAATPPVWSRLHGGPTTGPGTINGPSVNHRFLSLHDGAFDIAALLYFYQLTGVLLDVVTSDVWKSHRPGESSKEYVVQTFFGGEYLVAEEGGGCTIGHHDGGELPRGVFVRVASAVYHEDERLHKKIWARVFERERASWSVAVDTRCPLQKVGAPRVKYEDPPAESKWAGVYLCQCPPLAAFTKESGRQIVFKVGKTTDMRRLGELRSIRAGLRKTGGVILKMFVPLVLGDETNAEKELLILVCAMGLAWPHRNEEGALKTETVCVAPWQIGLLQDLMLRIAEEYDNPKLHTTVARTAPRVGPVPIAPRVELRLPVSQGPLFPY